MLTQHSKKTTSEFTPSSFRSVSQYFFHTYFVFLYRVCGLAQSLSLKFIELLLPLVHDYPLLMYPRSLSDTTEELDVILPVTCTQTERGKTLRCLYPYTFRNLRRKTGLCNVSYFWCTCSQTSGIDAGVDLHLRVRGDHAGPPGVGAHLGPHQISNDKLLTEASFLDHWGMMDLRNLNMNMDQSLFCF